MAYGYTPAGGLPRVDNNSGAPDMGGYTTELTTKLVPKVTLTYPTVGARDAAFAPMINGTGEYTALGPQKGMRCFVETGAFGWPDWCSWDGDEWIWDCPGPAGHVSDPPIATASPVNYETPQGHNPSLYTFTPTRSGLVEVYLKVSAISLTPGYGTGYLRPRYASGTPLPFAIDFTVLGEGPAGFRQDLMHKYPFKIHVTKGEDVSLVFDVWSYNSDGGASWAMQNAVWILPYA